METLLNLAGNTLFLLVIAGVFLAASLFAYALFERGSTFMAGYKETFTESASANMADMFMFVDATRLFYINIIWVATRTRRKIAPAEPGARQGKGGGHVSLPHGELALQTRPFNTRK